MSSDLRKNTPFNKKQTLNKLKKNIKKTEMGKLFEKLLNEEIDKKGK